jgi:hypothetical protein
MGFPAFLNGIDYGSFILALPAGVSNYTYHYLFNDIIAVFWES